MKSAPRSLSLWSSAALMAVLSTTTALVAPRLHGRPARDRTTEAAIRSVTTTTALASSTKPAPLFVDATAKQKQVQSYYSTTLQTSDDLSTNACCTAGAPPTHIQDCLSKLHPTTLAKYYGCGLCVPSYDLTGRHVLDLGCGAGRDVYVTAQLVGRTGRVVGVDMTLAQLEAAREQQDYHAAKFGFDEDVTEFVQGDLERLEEIEESVLPAGSFDLIISNCVLNLCADKGAVLRSCAKLLKEGGELYFSDVYASRRVPQVLQDDPVLWGECLSGALYWNDFENLARASGFGDVRLVEDAPVTVSNATVQATIDAAGCQNLEFHSATYRLWKMEALEPDCEDYGQAVVYKGTLPRAPSSWTLDKGHVFETGKIHPVCGNTFTMLEAPVLRDHFEFVGDTSRHYGIFEGCGSSMPYGIPPSSNTGSSTGKGGGGAAPPSGEAACC